MTLFNWLANISSDDCELLLYFFRIFLPLITLFLWIKGSSFTDLFDRLTTAITAVVSASLSFWYRVHERGTPDDNSGLKFQVTSKVDLPRGQKISRKWLVSWKPVSENNDQNMPMNIPSDAGAANDESPNDGTNIVYFDPNTGMTFNVNTSIQSIGGKELHGDTENETIAENVNDIQDIPPDETDKTK